MAAKKNIEKQANDPLNIDEIKREIMEYAEEKIDTEVELAVKRAEKRLINQKNFSLIKRNIIIILLTVISLYLTYLLYQTGYFEKFITPKEKPEEVIKVPNEEKEEEPDSETNKLLDKYSYLLDKIKLPKNSSYLEDYYEANLTDSLKLHLISQYLTEDDLITEEDTHIIENTKLKELFSKLFNPKNYKETTFEYKNVQFKYIKSQDIFIGEGELKDESLLLKRVPISIEKTDNKITILTVEALVEKEKIYDIKSKEKIATYTDETSLKNNKDKLSKLQYVFTCEDENCYLEKISLPSSDDHE